MNDETNSINTMGRLAIMADLCKKHNEIEAATVLDEAIRLIQSLTSKLATTQRRLIDARNELCLKCGRYKNAHRGACHGCRWRAERYLLDVQSKEGD